MRSMTFSIGAFLVVVLTMAMWPQDARFGSPSKAIAQQSDNSDDPSGNSDVNLDNPFDNPLPPKRKSTFSAPTPKVKLSPLAPAPKGKLTASDSTQRTQRTETALNQNVHFNFEDSPFSEIQQSLEAQMGLNLVLTQSAKDDALTADETITFEINGMPLGKALELMLAPYNATYVIDSGAVLFISLDEAEDKKWTRLKMFDCRELVKVLPKTAVPKKPAEEKKPSESTSDSALEMLVWSMTESEMWCQQQTPLQVVKGILIVRGSEAKLKQIGNLLVDLEGKLLSK